MRARRRSRAVGARRDSYGGFLYAAGMKRITFARWDAEQRKRERRYDRTVREFERIHGPKIKISLICDENIEAELVQEIKSLKYFRVAQPRKRTDDRRIWDTARRFGCAIVTADDSDFWNDKKFPMHESPLVLVLKGKNAEEKFKAFVRILVGWDLIRNYRRTKMVRHLKIRASAEHMHYKYWDAGTLVVDSF